MDWDFFIILNEINFILAFDSGFSVVGFVGLKDDTVCFFCGADFTGGIDIGDVSKMSLTLIFTRIPDDFDGVTDFDHRFISPHKSQ